MVELTAVVNEFEKLTESSEGIQQMAQVGLACLQVTMQNANLYSKL